MVRVKCDECGGAHPTGEACPKASNDNLPVANDNDRRAYARDYMRRRRGGAKSKSTLLKDAKAYLSAHAPVDPEGRKLIADLTECLGAEKHPGRKASKGA